MVIDTGPHDDLYGHGTACAAIIRGAAPRAEIMSVRVLGDRLTGKGFVFAEGLRWAVAHGARVINLSLSTGRLPSSASDPPGTNRRPSGERATCEN